MSLRTLRPKLNQIARRVKSPVVERIKGWRLKEIRKRILERDEFTCRRCHRVSLDLVVDHIVPLHLGGAESDNNRQALCPECHAKKTASEQRGRDTAGGA